MPMTQATIAGCSMLLTAGLTVGPEWEEKMTMDAGALPGSAAELDDGNGFPLSLIRGELEGTSSANGPGDFQDMFLLKVCDPDDFSAVLGATTAFDTQLWLFKFDERGLLANDNDILIFPLSAFRDASSDDGSGAEIMAGGKYYLAISGFNSDPTATGLPIFDQFASIETSGPDGPGGTLPITEWTGPGAFGAYTIRLTGVAFLGCPADFDCSTEVDFLDLLTLLSAWGPCALCQEDLDASGAVDFVDLLSLLAAWGRCGPP